MPWTDIIFPYNTMIVAQPRKKKHFDKKGSLSFVVAPRSLQDSALLEEGASQYVLVPKQVKDRRVDSDGRSVASSRTGAAPRATLDEVDEWVSEIYASLRAKLHAQIPACHFSGSSQGWL